MSRNVADPDDLFLFHDFLFDRRGGGLFRRDTNAGLVPVPMGARALDVLGALVERPGEVITRDEIIAAVWPGMVVEDNNLNMQIAALRRALDDGGTATSCIQTVPRRGYRFVASVIRDRRAAPSVVPLSDASEPGPTDGRSGNGSRPRYQLRGRIIAGTAATLILLVAAIAVWQVRSRLLAGAVALPRLSIIVMPFANLSGDPGQQYFVDGTTEDLTTDLSRLADMLVISRDTAFTYKDKQINAKQIGRDLGVHYVLEGSVQRSGNNVRVNAQLIDSITDVHVWAERFDRSIGDLLTLQNEITAHIAVALNLNLIASEAARPNEHPDALDHIFRGRAFIYKPASRSNFAEAIAEFEQALVLDPKSVEAQGRLAAALASRALDNMSDTMRPDLERAARLIEEALGTAPNDPLAHFAKGQLLRAQHHCEAAIPEYETVLASNRNAVASIGNIGRCKIYLGSIDEGVALEEQVIHFSPHDPFLGIWYFRIGQAILLQSRIDESIEWLNKANSEDSAYPFVAAWLAAAYGLKGDSRRAAAELADARRLNRNGSPLSIAAERAGAARDFTAPPTLIMLEGTYIAGLRKAGVPEE
jgi:adenylate cyclase